MKFIFFSFFFLSRNTPPYFCYTAGKMGGWTEDATAALYDHADRIPEIRAALESEK
jgi:hypothetical protein